MADESAAPDQRGATRQLRRDLGQDAAGDELWSSEADAGAHDTDVSEAGPDWVKTLASTLL